MLHRFELGLAQASRLHEHSVGHRDLADVVDAPRGDSHLDAFLAEAEFAREALGVFGDAAHVVAGVRIFRFDGRFEPFEGRFVTGGFEAVERVAQFDGAGEDDERAGADGFERPPGDERAEGGEQEAVVHPPTQVPEFAVVGGKLGFGEEDEGGHHRELARELRQHPCPVVAPAGEGEQSHGCCAEGRVPWTAARYPFPPFRRPDHAPEVGEQQHKRCAEDARRPLLDEARTRPCGRQHRKRDEHRAHRLAEARRDHDRVRVFVAANNEAGRAETMGGEDERDRDEAEREVYRPGAPDA